MRAQSLPISSGPPCAVLPLSESSAGNVRMGIFPSYFHVDHTLHNTQSLFQGIKWVEMLLQCLLGWMWYNKDAFRYSMQIDMILKFSTVTRNPTVDLQNLHTSSEKCSFPSTLPRSLFTEAVIDTCIQKGRTKTEYRFLGDVIVWEKSVISLSEKFVAEDLLRS